MLVVLLLSKLQYGFNLYLRFPSSFSKVNYLSNFAREVNSYATMRFEFDNAYPVYVDIPMGAYCVSAETLIRKGRYYLGTRNTV
jgi:hypothetical protein